MRLGAGIAEMCMVCGNYVWYPANIVVFREFFLFRQNGKEVNWGG
jgi:hypothetical protein